MPDYQTIVIASANPHKAGELRELLMPLGIELKTTADYPDGGEVVEDQPDLEGNALKKARHWYRVTGLPSLADDTGLEVDALNGEPGVYSARYAGEQASYEQNTAKLLRELDGNENRKARFRTVIAFIDGEKEKVFEGICEGVITEKPVGSKGFGYDPVFRPERYQQTFAELSAAEKNRISHRGRALQNFLKFLA